MIQLTREEVQQVLTALQSLFGVPDKYTGLGGGAVAVWRLGGSAAPMDAISILKSKLTEPAPKPMTEEEINSMYKAELGYCLCPTGDDLRLIRAVELHHGIGK